MQFLDSKIYMNLEWIIGLLYHPIYDSAKLILFALASYSFVVIMKLSEIVDLFLSYKTSKFVLYAAATQ